MSTHQHVTTNSKATTNGPASTNPFNAVFDDNLSESEDEWWEDEEDRSKKAGAEATSLRITKWPVPPQSHLLDEPISEGSSCSTTGRRYSVQKPIREKSTRRQKKQNARAGIKVITTVTRHKALTPVLVQSSESKAQQGRFVDLAALRALNGDLSAKGNDSSFKQNISRNAFYENESTPGPLYQRSRKQTLEDEAANMSQDRLNASPAKSISGLSPADRPIVIGLSIPSTNKNGRTHSTQSANSASSNLLRSYEQQTPTAVTPETPTIIITPAQDTSLWSMLGKSGMRATSSIYSQAPGREIHSDAASNVPSVPQIPAAHLEEERARLAGMKSYFSPDSDDSPMWGDRSATKSRVTSTCTVFEEDESPVMFRKGRVRSMSGGSVSVRHPSMSTIGTRRQSTGWWNYITTPFMTRSNTFAHRGITTEPVPAVPDLVVAASKAQAESRDEKVWEKEFSPLTPPTTTTIKSDHWWEADSKKRHVQMTPDLRDTRHKVEASTGTLPLIIPEIGEFSAADSPGSFAGSSHQLRRGDTTSTMHTTLISGVSPNDREIPMVFATPPIPSQDGPILKTAVVPVSDTHNPNNPTPVATVSTTRGSTAVSTPPPPYSPSPARLKRYRPIFPPDHALSTHYFSSTAPVTRYPPSPAPLSPGLQAAMTSQGSIPLSDVPLTPASRRPTNLNSGYPSLHPRHEYSSQEFAPPPISKKTRKAEAKRRRHEKEDALAHKAGGLWRGRGCISNRGCYGRGGAEGRKRRRWYIVLIVFFLSLILLAVVLATQLVRKSSTVEEPSRWLNLTGFPPILTGLSTVIAPVNFEADTGCVFPSTQWSCSLPKELQSTIVPHKSDQPHFLLRIQWDNSTEANKTFANVTQQSAKSRRSAAGNPVTARQFVRHVLLKARQAVTIISTPTPPSYAEQFFLGNSTDGVISKDKAGESTPFYISMLDTASLNPNTTTSLAKRQKKNSTSDFPDIGSVIPAPSLAADGTAAPANLLPFPSQQPIRLFDRGLPTEHYSFYTYYDRSIFLKSIKSLDGSNLGTGEVPDDRNGGAKGGEAKFRCTWRETRFLVQIWTRKNGTSRLLNSTRSSIQNIDTAQTPAPVNLTQAAQDFTQPGSFPYPVTITIDRHGGDPAKKMLYCYNVDDRRGLIVKSAQLHEENRGFGGSLINKAPGLFGNVSDPTLGGFDGGSGGCACKWRNFEDVIRV